MYKVCKLFATDRWFSTDTPVSFTNKINCHDIVESGLKYHKHKHK